MIKALVVKDGHKTLNISWSNGEQNNLSASFLRENARDAVAKRESLDGLGSPLSEDLTITKINVVGLAGLNIQFSDGHDRAIYPFSYLRELSDMDDNKLTLSEAGKPQSGSQQHLGAKYG